MAHQPLMDAIMGLTTPEKLELIDTLWAEAARELRARPLTEAEQRFLDDRLRDAETHPDEEVDWNEARDQIAAGK